MEGTLRPLVPSNWYEAAYLLEPQIRNGEGNQHEHGKLASRFETNTPGSPL